MTSAAEDYQALRAKYEEFAKVGKRLPVNEWMQLIRLEEQRLGLRDDMVDDSINYMVEIPGLGDVVHLVPRAKISEEEMAAHRRALRYGFPSPLSQRQLDTLKWKREMYLKIRSSPVPEVQRYAGYWLNKIENVGDMMSATYWGGKGILYLLSKIGLKMRGPASRYTGWALIAKDIADVINLFKAARASRSKAKGDAHKSSSMNPFSKESKYNRGFKLKAKLPGIPDWIEIFQVTDELFGVGISFGSVVGFVQDLIWGVRKGAKIKVPSAPRNEAIDL